jgi:hypothetical protein
MSRKHRRGQNAAAFRSAREYRTLVEQLAEAREALGIPPTQADYTCPAPDCGAVLRCRRCTRVLADCRCERAQEPECPKHCDRRVNLTALRVAVLYQLATPGTHYTFEVAQAVGRADGAVTGVVDHLIECGLLVKEQESEAARLARGAGGLPRRLLTLSPTGEDLVRRLQLGDVTVEEDRFSRVKPRKKDEKVIINHGNTEWCARWLADHVGQAFSLGDVYDAAVAGGFTGPRNSVGFALANLLIHPNNGSYPTTPGVRFERVKQGVYRAVKVEQNGHKSVASPAQVPPRPPVGVPASVLSTPPGTTTYVADPPAVKAETGKRVLHLEVLAGTEEKILARDPVTEKLYTVTPFAWEG